MDSNAKSAGRALSILLLLAGRARPTAAATIARELGLPRSTTYHLLKVMGRYNFVAYYPDERSWGLGTAAFELGSAYLRGESLERLGGPVLDDLVEDTGEIAHLGILRGADVLILRQRRPRTTLSLITEEGVRIPAHLTSLGRAILMELCESEFRALYRADDLLVRRSGRGPLIPADLGRELEESRIRGYAIDDEFLTLGITCIGAPVFSHENRPLASLSISFISVHHPRDEWDELANSVKRAANRLSRALGWKPIVRTSRSVNARTTVETGA
jgi:DNA-binding IclR family transcriptional regulator